MKQVFEKEEHILTGYIPKDVMQKIIKDLEQEDLEGAFYDHCHLPLSSVLRNR